MGRVSTLGTYLLSSSIACWALGCSGGAHAGSDPAGGGGAGDSPAHPSGGATSLPTGGTGGQPSTATGGSGGSAGDGCDPTLSAANRALVGEALDKLFVDKDLSAIDEYWSEPYDQHNPIAPSGVEAFRQVMTSFVPSPSFTYERLRTLAECDLVVVQGRYSQTGIIFDMFRVSGGKIIEHWDSDTNQASNADGPTELSDFDETAQHRAHVLAFIDQVLVRGESDKIDDYLAADYTDRRQLGTSGPQALLDYLAGESITYEKVHHVVADGNFVFTLSEGTRDGAGYGLYDLFRLEDGRIVERWDSRRVVPETTASGLGIF